MSDFDNIYDLSSKMPGSTVTPGYVETQKLVVGEIEFTNNDEPANTVKSISHNFNDNEVDKFPSSKALYEALARVAENIREIDPNSNFFRDNTVVSLSLINEGFDRDEWEYTLNWLLDNGVAIFTQDNKENFIKITSKYFSSIGHYFIVVDVKQIPSGYLKVTNHIFGETLFEIKSAGVHYIEFYTSVPDIEHIKIEAIDTFPHDQIILNKVGLYKVTSRFRNYIDYRFRQLLNVPGSPGFITEEHVQFIVDDAINGLRSYLLDVIDQLDDTINIHLGDKNNPHQVTIHQINAAHKDHTHSEFNTLDAAIRSIAVDLADHESNYNNPHNVTLEQLGGANAQHNHDDLYSKLNHKHDDRYPKKTELQELTTVFIKEYMSSIVEEEEDPTLPGVFPSSYTLSNPKYIGTLPVNGKKARLSYPFTPVISKYIIHPDKQDYSYYEGYAYTSVLPLTNNPAIYAFKAHLDEYDRSVSCVGFGSTKNSTLNEPVKITYEFFTPRSITGYTIYNDQTEKINGYVTGWSLNVDDIKGSLVTNNTWTEKGKAGNLPVSIGKTLTGRKFTFLITSINANLESQNAGTYNWGFRVEFKFSDVNEKELKLPFGISCTLSNALKFDDVSNLSIMTNVDESCTPEYLYLKQNKSIEKDEEGYKYLKYTPSLVLSRIAPEHSFKRLGIPQMMDRFNDAKEHDIFGTISATSEHHDYPVQNLYNTDLSKTYRTEDNVVETTITHTFITPVNISGFTFVFNKNNDYPDTWSVTYSRATYADTVVNEVNHFTLKYLDITLNENQESYQCIHDTIYESVNKVTIKFKGTKSQTYLMINQVFLMLSDWYHNPTTGVSTDSYMIPLGRIDHYRSDTKNYMGFKLHHNAVGKICTIPVNNLYKVDTTKKSSFNLYNPYQCTDLHITPYMINNNGDRVPATASNILITDITVDNIIVKVLTKNIFILEVCRLW